MMDDEEDIYDAVLAHRKKNGFYTNQMKEKYLFRKYVLITYGKENYEYSWHITCHVRFWNTLDIKIKNYRIVIEIG